MKKRIAVFGCGWSNEYLMVVSEIFKEFAEQHQMDLYYFINYSETGNDSNEGAREANIYNLPDFSLFDGVVILGNTLHLEEEFALLTSAIAKANVPAVCLGYRLDGISCFECNNYNGMVELVEHLVGEHGVKDVVYVGGPRDNQESLLREKALTDVLERYNYVLKPENILCGNWNYYETQSEIKTWYEENEGRLPDAFVCANDVMAMGCYVGLIQSGLKNLNEVIVTGFDALISARMFSPSITSVDPGWEEMANRAMEHLNHCIANGNEVIYEIVQSHSSIRSSCGCHVGEGTHLKKGREIFLGYERMVSGSFLGGHMCELDYVWSLIHKREDIPKFFEFILSTQQRFEGDEFYLCFVENFFETLENGTILKNYGYTPKMHLIGGIRDEKVVEPETFDTKALLPSCATKKEGVNQYLFMPLSSRSECYGYIIMVNNLEKLYDYSMFVWSFSVGQDIERVRQNLTLAMLNQQLSTLSVTDALTGVYNRMGCEKVAFPLIESCYKAGKNAVMLFMDINKMKVINDTYGHEQGDIAIKMTANALRFAVPSEWVVVRYGGDEFLAVGECANEHEVEVISERIHNLLSQVAVENNFPYPLTIGIGSVYVRPDEELDLHECLRVADAKMYQMKKERGEKK